MRYNQGNRHAMTADQIRAPLSPPAVTSVADDTTNAASPWRVGVVVPCFKVRNQILDVLAAMPAQVEKIYCVDDGCPDKSGIFIEANCQDARVHVIFHAQNQGVGGAVITGYRRAIRDGMEIVVKIDGDGQMDPALIPVFTSLIEAGDADYCKGNRFFRPATLIGMPAIRIVGNAVLSFLTKISSGYWNVIDPTNGYTAIHTTALKLLRLEDIDRSYFFESIRSAPSCAMFRCYRSTRTKKATSQSIESYDHSWQRTLETFCAACSTATTLEILMLHPWSCRSGLRLWYSALCSAPGSGSKVIRKAKSQRQALS